MMKRGIAGLVLLAILPLARPAPADAQNPIPEMEDRGWIGIRWTANVRGHPGVEDAGGSGVVVLTWVYEGSPAAQAGLEAGDTILTVNGTPADQAFGRLELEPGDRVIVSLRRAGEDRTVTLTAAERPEAMGLFRVTPAERIRMDSVRSRIVRFMEDSAVATLRPVPFRVRGEEVRAGDRRAGHLRIQVEPDSARGRTVEPDFPGVVLRREGPGFNWFRYEGGESSFPFSAFIARSETTDSILREMHTLRARLEEARRTELQRQRELAESLARERRRIDRSDEELQRTRRLQEELRARLAMTQALLERESRLELQARAGRVDSTGARAPEGVAAALPRFPAPHALGRTVVAGAQLLPLNEGLGRYFGTNEGLLVTEVVPGSPAEAAGVEPGDVLVAVAGETVRSVSDVRAPLSDARRWPVELILLRQGERLTVRLAR